ncbi:AraC family transcriptional regulator [Paenibacillus sp. 598K]|uniref:AraC family transcriptional regulator n=1 Tax=Paenibacillus sp. 598K TaxID=1117987 RepID=UPI000FF991BB|nr:AraC family transcriptional regulator [Paenibacillus sp. 598K]GBF76622.1 AraC family transcriptional regulator [Paenibacillus sp. 598K]
MTNHEQVRLWNDSYLHIVDIRHSLMEQGERLVDYQLPACAFIYSVRGQAQIWLDHQPHDIKRFHLFHGGKGARITIWAEEDLDYYIVLYKPLPVLLREQELTNSAAPDVPLIQRYAFVPARPITLLEMVEQMYSEWSTRTELSRMLVKSVFYRFLYESNLQWEEQKFQRPPSDFAVMARGYIEAHYEEQLTLAAIANVFKCSEGHLSRQFKQRWNVSPMHYVNHLRVAKACKLLQQTDATLQQIAEHVGFPDAHSFSRSFKKQIGLPPARYRKPQVNDLDLPKLMQGFALQAELGLPYTDTENHYQYRLGSELSMQKRTKLAFASLAMSMTLLMSACGAGNAETGTTTAAESAPAEQKTRIVSTAKGDVEIPANPQRVAADQYMGHLLKLGIVPVGVRTFMLQEAWLEKSGIDQTVLDGIEDLGDFPMNLEKLASLDPDLIISSINENGEQYEKIGTTLFVPYWEELTTPDPLDKFRTIGSIFGKEQEAEQWISEYKARVEEAKVQIKDIIKEGETVSIIQIGWNGLYVLAAQGGNYGSSTIYQMLELPPTQKAMDMEKGFEMISMEVLSEYAGDHIFLYGADDEGSESVLDSKLWKSLPAVKNGNVYAYGSSGEKSDEFVMEDPFSLDLQLEKVVKVMLETEKLK